MNRINSTVIAVAIYTIANPVWAGFLNKKSDWDALNAASQVAYSQGVFDNFTAWSTLDGAEARDLKKHRLDCAIDLGMTGVDLAEMVNIGYQEIENWKLPPMILIYQGLFKACGAPE